MASILLVDGTYFIVRFITASKIDTFPMSLSLMAGYCKYQTWPGNRL